MGYMKIREDLSEDLGAQLAALRKDMASLAKLFSRRGAVAYDSAQDSAAEMADAIWKRLQDAMPVVRRGMRSAEKVARKNPTATVATVGLVVAVLAVALFMRRGSEDTEGEENAAPARKTPRRRSTDK